MSFDTSSPGEQRMMAKECRPNYEEQAASQLKKLKATQNLFFACASFQEVNSLSPFRNITSFAEFLGGLYLIKEEQNKSYNKTLALIEKEKE